MLTRFLRIAAPAAFAVVLALGQARAFQPSPGDVGVNLTNYLHEYATEIAFVDAFRQSSAWAFAPKPGAAKTTADPGVSEVGPDGWVRSLRTDQQAVARMFASGDGRYPGGLYTVLYDGDGDIAFAEPNKVVGRRPGRIELQVNPGPGAPGIALVLRATNPADPVRNIRVILPGFEDTYRTKPWYPPFLKALKPFNTLRFMAWQTINIDRQKDWADRRLPSYATQASPPLYRPAPLIKGVSYEDIIALANELGANPWVSVPTQATDDYIREMAKLFRRTLKPGLHPMVEYSNEIWNPSFPSTFCHLRAQAIALNLGSNLGSPCTKNAEGDDVLPANPFDGIGQYRYYGLRTSQIFDIWDAEYGADKDAIVHVVAEWNGVPQEIDAVMTYGQTANKLAQKADVIATGAYVSAFGSIAHAVQSGRTSWDRVTLMAPTEVTRAMREAIDAELAPRLRAVGATAKKWGLGLVVYEGGDGNWAVEAPVPYRDGLARLFAAAARDPSMGEVYTHLLDVWKASGGTLFTQFYDVGGYGVFGDWGLLEYQDQPLDSSPKYKAIADWIQTNRKP